FPVDPEQRSICVSLLGFETSHKLPKRAEICSNDFQQHDIECGLSGKCILRKGAVPLAIHAVFNAPGNVSSESTSDGSLVSATELFDEIETDLAVKRMLSKLISHLKSEFDIVVGDYEKTFKKLKIAEISSDIQSSDDFELQEKRQRKKPRRLILEESSNEELGQRALPPPPSVKYSRIINSTICGTPIVKKVASPSTNDNSPTPQGINTINRTYLSPSVPNFDKPAHEAILTYVIQIKEQNKQILSLLNNLQSGIPEYSHLPADLPVTFPINNLA
ncbi:unnamed protein product, partial [Callosobruchus maculatus]